MKASELSDTQVRIFHHSLKRHGLVMGAYEARIILEAAFDQFGLDSPPVVRISTASDGDAKRIGEAIDRTVDEAIERATGGESNPLAEYSTRVKCDNCQKVATVDVPKGRQIGGAQCPTCGCQALRKARAWQILTSAHT